MRISYTYLPRLLIQFVQFRRLSRWPCGLCLLRTFTLSEGLRYSVAAIVVEFLFGKRILVTGEKCFSNRQKLLPSVSKKRVSNGIGSRGCLPVFLFGSRSRSRIGRSVQRRHS